MSDDKTPENMDAILRRIQKLLAVAEDGRGNAEEAAAAAAMAAKIMRKYQLEHADVLVSTMQRGEGMETQDRVVSAKTNGTVVKAVPAWAQWSAVAVAKAHDVLVTMTLDRTTGEAGMRFKGFASDVQVAVWVFDYLTGTLLRLCEAYRKTEQYRVLGRTAGDSYRRGVAVGMVAALQKTAQEAKATSAGTALVVAKIQAVQAHFGEAKYTQKTSKAKIMGGVFSNGVRDGRAVDVNRRGVGHTTQADTLRIGR
jgi:hypothetical protein